MNEKLAGIYANLCKEVDELHDKYEGMKVEPSAHVMDRHHLMNLRSSAGPCDYTISPLYTVPYLLYEINKKRNERRELQHKIMWLSDGAAHKQLIDVLMGEEQLAMMTAQAQERGEYN